ncbi:hypothetical protein T439DRAFT_376739 [Meredithblackwellia eburnea MCA 4105]
MIPGKTLRAKKAARSQQQQRNVITAPPGMLCLGEEGESDSQSEEESDLEEKLHVGQMDLGRSSSTGDEEVLVETDEEEEEEEMVVSDREDDINFFPVSPAKPGRRSNQQRFTGYQDTSSSEELEEDSNPQMEITSSPSSHSVNLYRVLRSPRVYQIRLETIKIPISLLNINQVSANQPMDILLRAVISCSPSISTSPSPVDAVRTVARFSPSTQSTTTITFKPVQRETKLSLTLNPLQEHLAYPPGLAVHASFASQHPIQPSPNQQLVEIAHYSYPLANENWDFFDEVLSDPVGRGEGKIQMSVWCEPQPSLPNSVVLKAGSKDLCEDEANSDVDETIFPSYKNLPDEFAEVSPKDEESATLALRKEEPKAIFKPSPRYFHIEFSARGVPSLWEKLDTWPYSDKWETNSSEIRKILEEFILDKRTIGGGDDVFNYFDARIFEVPINYFTIKRNFATLQTLLSQSGLSAEYLLTKPWTKGNDLQDGGEEDRHLLRLLQILQDRVDTSPAFIIDDRALVSNEPLNQWFSAKTEVNPEMGTVIHMCTLCGAYACQVHPPLDSSIRHLPYNNSASQDWQAQQELESDPAPCQKACYLRHKLKAEVQESPEKSQLILQKLRTICKEFPTASSCSLALQLDFPCSYIDWLRQENQLKPDLEVAFGTAPHNDLLDQCKFNVEAHCSSSKRRTSVRHATNPEMGFGLFALEDIPKGTCISLYAGEWFHNAEKCFAGVWREAQDMSLKELLPTPLVNYKFGLGNTQLMDTVYSGNGSRFLNDPNGPIPEVEKDGKRENCYAKVIQISGTTQVALYAGKDIKEHDELFFPYGEGYWIARNEPGSGSEAETDDSSRSSFRESDKEEGMDVEN